jgi:hypothetical protein
MEDLELEHLYEVWHNKEGWHIEIGPDRDGLDLIEIRRYNDSGKITDRLTFDVPTAKLVKEALEKLLKETP